jgi:phosphate starvation-inducible PhoH-like protein
LIRRHTIADADNRRLAQACGALDEHLRRIEESLGVSLQRRGATFRIQGPGPAVDRAVALIDTLYASAGHPIEAAQLQLMLLEDAAGVPALGAPPPARALAKSAPPAADTVLHTRHADLRGRTPNQVRYLQQMLAHDITFGIGPAGTGKSFLAVACAVDALERQGVQRIVLTRPAVEAGERLGFLLYDLMGFDRVGKAFDKGQIEVAPLAFMRGRTLNHAFVILDEAQNTTREQMQMFLTRIGFGSRCVVNGDTSQIDLAKGIDSGLVDAQRVLADVKGIAFTQFTAADVVRHPLVARIVDAYEQHAGPRR